MKMIAFVFFDLAAFFIGLFLTYFAYANILNFSISILVVKAYIKWILFLSLYFIVILNMVGLYNLKKNSYNHRRIFIACFVYFLTILIFSWIYPKYQFARTLLFINLTILYFLITVSRFLARQFFEKK